MLERFAQQVPSIRLHASAIPPYHPQYGPAFSANGGHPCLDCCAIQQTCNREDCTATGVNFDKCMGAAIAQPQYHVGALLGPPDASPARGIIKGTYFPGCHFCGKQFFVMELPEPIYLQQVLVYETGALGTVVALSAAETYLGNATAWQSLWEGVPSEQDYSDYIFQPPICPTITMAARYVKVVFDTDLADNTVSFDSLAFEGSIEPPRNVAWNDARRLFYRPLEGIHFRYGSLFQDKISVRASNCEGSSPPRTIALEGNLGGGSVPRSLFRDSQEVTAATGTDESGEDSIPVCFGPSVLCAWRQDSGV